MNVSDAAPSDLEWLFARQRFGVDLGLKRVEELLGRLGRPQDAFETVLVGGTNGKGSTAATLSSILNVAGRRTALWYAMPAPPTKQYYVSRMALVA